SAGPRACRPPVPRVRRGRHVGGSGRAVPQPRRGTVSRVRDESGGAAVELVLATPFIVLLMLFVLFGGRLTVATADVNAAARASARAASLARSPAAATTAAEDTARRELEAEGVPCDGV